MSESLQRPTYFKLLDTAKEVTKFLLHEINVLPTYLQRHWDVVFAFTTSAAAASAVFKYLANHQGNPEKIELAVFHIIRLFEVRPDCKELLVEPQKLISEMDSEVTTMIDQDLITRHEAKFIARRLKRDVTAGVVRLAGTSSGSLESIRDESPMLFLTTSPARPSFAIRGGYGLNYDDPELYPSSESVSPASSPARLSCPSSVASLSSCLPYYSPRSPRSEFILVPQNNLDSQINMEISKVETGIGSLIPEQVAETAEVRLDQPNFPSRFGTWPCESSFRMGFDNGNTEVAELDNTPVKISPISVASSTSIGLPGRSPIPSFSASPQPPTPSPLEDTNLPALHTARNDCPDALSSHTLLAVIPPPYEPITKPPPESPNKKFSRGRGTQNSPHQTRNQAVSEAKRPGAAKTELNTAKPKPAPNTAKPKPVLRASTRTTRYQGRYTK